MTEMPTSCLYRGLVLHRRLRPKKHMFRYRVFSLFLNLDELDHWARKLALFSHNKFNLFSLWDKDHGQADGGSLKGYVSGLLSKAGMELEGGKVFLLCYPRILGYVFNPLAVYYCYHKNGTLAAVLYEVSNTFHERHSYLFSIRDGAEKIMRHSCDKAFYVSPFISLDSTYDFRLSAPGKELSLVICQSEEGAHTLNASFIAARDELSNRTLGVVFFKYPLMTLKIILGIHWQAFRLWRKGIRFLRHSRAPENPLTIINSPIVKTSENIAE